MKVFIIHASVDANYFGPWLDAQPVIRNWYGFIPNCYVVASKLSCDELAAAIRLSAPGFLFVLTQVFPGLSDGYFSADFWSFLNDPKDSGRHPISNPLLAGQDKTALLGTDSSSK
ncbi:MAG: hypothetical protein ABT19_10185 [Rhodanobacter sp. SCN 68-63]|nr:MAG: hypothetical protein ABT19_10185 [Rhodanobacter sp. SCN 68-63]